MLTNQLKTINTVRNKVAVSIELNSLFPTDDRLLLAVSGGQDSMCLLDLFLRRSILTSRFPHHQISVVHCDHGWATDAGISTMVSTVCKQFGVQCYTLNAPKGLKETEAAAREWRYKAISETAISECFKYVLTGHTQTDQAETVLHNLVRGCGIKGLSGMPWHKDIGNGISLVRPMLKVSREETAAYCKEANIPVWEDVLNSSDLYTRCRIRNQVMPLLEQTVNPKARQHIADLAHNMAETEDCLSEIAAAIFESCLDIQNNLQVEPLKKAHIAIQKRVIKLFLESNTTKAVRKQYIDNILELYSSKTYGVFSCLPKGDSVVLKETRLTYIKNHSNNVNNTESCSGKDP